MCSRCKKRPAASCKGRCKECLAYNNKWMRKQYKMKKGQPLNKSELDETVANYLAIQPHCDVWEVWTKVGPRQKANYKRVQELRSLAAEVGMPVYYFGTNDLNLENPEKLYKNLSIPTY